MIRSDYLLRMVEEFMQTLARIRALKKDRRFAEAEELAEVEFKRIAGLNSESLLRLTETELLAKLIQTEPTNAVHEKTLFLAALLRETGDMAAAKDSPDESRACYLKGLHLLLESLGRSDAFEHPDFVPKVDEFVAALMDSELPIRTQAALMEHYERTGQFAKAEDALFAILDSEPENSAVLDFGISFYERLQRQSDARLVEGDLPRMEAEAGLNELRARKTKG